MQLNDQESIFSGDVDITIEGYCTCDLYFQTTKQVNFQKNKAHYAQIFYLACKHGLYQLFIFEELNICEIDKVDGFEEPAIILDNKLSENYLNILYHYHSINKANNNRTQKIYAYSFPIEEDVATFIYDFKDFIILIDEFNYTDVQIFFKKRASIPELNYEEFKKYVLDINQSVTVTGSLDEKLYNYKKKSTYKFDGGDGTYGNQMRSR